MHNPDANLETCVQGKQVYAGLHHLVQILYYNHLVCVCVCACSQDLKLAVKQALELLLLPPSKASELITSQLVACFWCPFSLAYTIASYGCCSCCSCSTKVEKEKEVTTT